MVGYVPFPQDEDNAQEASRDPNQLISYSDVLHADLRQQSLAQLGLYRVEEQYPLHVVIPHKNGENSWTEMVDRKLSEFSPSKQRPPLPHLEYTQPKDAAHDAQQLPELSLAAGLQTRFLQINSKIQQQSLQGQVYLVDVLLHVKARDRSDRVIRVNAVMKKSPIYKLQDWKDLQAIRQIKRWRVLHGESRSLQGHVKPQTVTHQSLAATSLLTERTVLHLLDQLQMAHDASDEKLDKREESLQISLDQQFHNYKNEAYMDALGSYIGSRLVEEGFSPFHGLLYDTFRANDSSYWTQKDEDLYGAGINQDFPVQITIMQQLNGSIGDLKEEGLLDSPEQRASAMFQELFGLAQLQRTFRLVQNDLHLGNILYQKVPPETVLWYEYRGIWYQVPTFGFVLKMIDFGRVSLYLNGRTLVSSFWDEGEEKVPFQVSNSRIDMVRLMDDWTYLMPELENPPSQRQGNEMLDAYTQVISTVLDGSLRCLVPTQLNTAPSKIADLRAWVKACGQNHDSNECHAYAYVWGTANNTIQCPNAVASIWIPEFKVFQVPRQSIPVGSLVYRL